MEYESPQSMARVTRAIDRAVLDRGFERVRMRRHNDDDDEEEANASRAKTNAMTLGEHDGGGELGGATNRGESQEKEVEGVQGTPETPRRKSTTMMISKFFTPGVGDSARERTPRTPDSTTSRDTTSTTLDVNGAFIRFFNDLWRFAKEVFIGIPLQILVTFIALVSIPTMLQVQAVMTVMSFWGIYAAMAIMFHLRAFLRVSGLERVSSGIDELFEQTEAEVEIFRERITFLFPTSPATCSKQARNNISSRRECAKKLKELAKSIKADLAATDLATLDLAHGLLLAA